MTRAAIRPAAGSAKVRSMKRDAMVRDSFASCQGTMPRITVDMTMYMAATTTMERMMDRGMVFTGFLISSAMLQTWL